MIFYYPGSAKSHILWDLQPQVDRLKSRIYGLQPFEMVSLSCSNKAQTTISLIEVRGLRKGKENDFSRQDYK